MPWRLVQHNLTIFAHISKWTLIAIFKTRLSSFLVGPECVRTLHVFISMHGKVFSLINKFLCPLESARADSELTFGKLQADTEQTRNRLERRQRKGFDFRITPWKQLICLVSLIGKGFNIEVIYRVIDRMPWPIRVPTNQ